MSAPFRVRHQPVSGRLCRPRPGRGRHAGLVSRCLSAAGIRFSAILSRLVFRPSCDRPTGTSRHRTMTGFPRSAHARYDRDRAPSVPRDQRCSTLTGRCPRPAARRITTATVLCPGASTVIYPGLHRHEASVKGSRRSPARPSPHLWPPDDSGALGLFPGLRTHADRTRARTPGRGQAQSTSLEPRLRHLRHAGPPICEFTRPCATSCRIADPAFGYRVHPGRPDVAEHGPDPGIGEDRVECGRVV